MDFLDDITTRNVDFAAHDFDPSLKMLPSKQTVIVGCVDPRVDPVDIFKLKAGEAVVIRNVGGRINSALLETMAILRAVAQSKGKDIGEGWTMIVLHHTDCGIIGAYEHAPEILAKHLEVTVADLAHMAVKDPYEAVRQDVAALKADRALPAGFTISGVVYDVHTGGTEIIVPPSRLREE
jgi:carbonic anhydrase